MEACLVPLPFHIVWVKWIIYRAFFVSRAIRLLFTEVTHYSFYSLKMYYTIFYKVTAEWKTITDS